LGSPSSTSVGMTSDTGSFEVDCIPAGTLLTVARGRGRSALPSASSPGLCRCRWGCRGPLLRPPRTSRLCSRTWCRRRIPPGELWGGERRSHPEQPKPRQGGLQRKHLIKHFLKQISQNPAQPPALEGAGGSQGAPDEQRGMGRAWERC